MPRKATDRSQFGFIGRRQQHHHFDAATKLTVNPTSKNEVAGMMAGIKHSHHIRLELCKKAQTAVVTLYYVSGGEETITGMVKLPDANNTSPLFIFILNTSNAIFEL